MANGRFTFCKKRFELKSYFFIIAEVIATYLFYYYVVKPILFPPMPTTLEIYQEAYKQAYGKDAELPDYLKTPLK